MSSQQNASFFVDKEISAGGPVYLPPTVCLHSADLPAHVAATGRARTDHFSQRFMLEPDSANIPYLESQHDA
jgi:hypothetical protein